MVGGGGGAVSPLQQLVHYQVRPLAAHAGCPQRTPAHEEGAGQQRQQAAPAGERATPREDFVEFVEFLNLS